MDAKSLITFLLNSNNLPVLSDPYFNDVRLLMRLDKDANALGLPLYRDYSRYQYPVREWIGESDDSRITFLDNPTEGLPALPTSGDVAVQSYCYIPNKYNHSIRLTELNVNTDKTTTLPVSYLETMMAGLDGIDIGTGNFTIEFSFFADEVNLPWRWQTLWVAGNGNLRLNATNFLVTDAKTYINPSSDLYGWGCYLKDNNLVFLGNNWEIQLNNDPIQKLTWYHICLERINGVLKVFINTNQVKTVTFTQALNTTGFNSFDNKVRIGACQPYVAVFFGGSFFTKYNMVDTSFSGGFTNFRITANSRYAGNFYTLTLPHPTLPVDNKVDSYYIDTLFNLPFSYDFYNYANNHAHFNNRTYLKGVPNFQTGFLPITGYNTYETKSAGTALNTDEWTIEFFICPTLDGNVAFRLPRNYGQQSEWEWTFREWLENYRVRQIANNDFFTPVNLVSLRSNGKKVIDINLNYVGNRSTGAYFALKASSNGDDWLTYPFDDNLDWNQGTSEFGYYSFILPNDEVKFYPSYSGGGMTALPQSTDANKDVIHSGYNPNPTHIAISRYNNMLYVLVNGSVIKTAPFNYTLYQYSSDLKLTLCGYSFTEIIGSTYTDNVSRRLGVALKGVRVTNKARYSFVSANNVQNLNSVQPLPLTNGVIPPSRARVVDIKRTVTSPSVSASQVSWDVYLSQPVDNLTIDDFTLTGVGGVVGYSLVSLTKLSEYKYRVLANTGSNNGDLSLNFIDRHTVKYKGKNTYISYFSTELDVEGEAYVINKNAPIPYLTSGSNPYVSSSFVVKLTFDAAISTFDSSKIGVVNGSVSNVQLIDELSQTYNVTIEPVREGLVIVQCMEGVGVTDGNLPSSKSAPFVRIFSSGFAILQTPLNLANTIYDLSPSRIVLDDVIDNNVEYSPTIYPIGENSSLYVRPNLEQSGLRNIGYNAVGSTIDAASQDWTIEFFLRVNSTQDRTSKKAHILSVENPSTGFCVFVENGQLRIQRTVASGGNLLGSLTMADKDTNTFVNWTDGGYSQLQKYPHFAITHKNGVYRFYRNGRRVGLIQSSTIIDISKGDLYIGYYPNRVDDIDYYLSNVRMTLGKALYTAYEINVPGLPYTVLPNITDEAELLNYISIYSNNQNSGLAKIGDTVTLKFSAIINLQHTPAVTILGRSATVTKNDLNVYTATTQIQEGDADGQVPFSITIAGEPSIPTKVFTNTTNDSKLTVDNLALGASITSDSPDDGSYVIEAVIGFTEAIRGFSANDLVLSNCKVGNIRKVSNENKYLFTITGIATGEISVQLPINVVQDLAGNYNTASNTFTRTVAVPAYVPDSHFDNVLLLIQPENSIVDESNFNVPITLTTVELVDSEAPQGLTKSIYFDGKDSSMNLNLTSTLNSTEPYTIEFFAYFKSSVVFRLAPPHALPGSELTSTSFKANWDAVEDASSYVLDVSKQGNFTTYVPGYKHLNVGNSTAVPISSTKMDVAPKLKYTRLRSAYGFVGEWNFTGEQLAYKYDVALDSNFTNTLYSYTNRLSNTPYASVGSVENARLFSPPVVLPGGADDIAPYNTTSGVVLTGLLSNTNYPKLFYFLEENTLRLYPKDGYVIPAVAEDIDPSEWYHIAIVNDIKYTYLYVNGKLMDRVKNASFGSSFDVGYSIGHFYGFLTGIRITKGVKRYSKEFDVPKLPFSKD